MAHDIKTKETYKSVGSFIKSIENDQRRRDTQTVVQLMEEVTGAKPAMWGTSIIGFGKYTYTYADGHEGQSFLTGVSPRKDNLTLYLMSGLSKVEGHLDKLGPHKTGKACLYIKKLEQVDAEVLKSIIEDSVAHVKEKEA